MGHTAIVRTWQRGLCVMLIVGIAAPIAWAQPAGPVISLRPTAGPAGTEVLVTGGGFDPDTCAVALYLDSTTNGLLAFAEAGSSGFRTSMVIPVGTSPGAHEVIALGQFFGAEFCDAPSGEQASATFTVREVAPPIPLIDFDEVDGTPGTVVTVRGANFCGAPECGTVDILVAGLPAVQKVQVNPDGTFEAEAVMPGGTPVGENPILARQMLGDGDVLEGYGSIFLSVRPNFIPVKRLSHAMAQEFNRPMASALDFAPAPQKPLGPIEPGYRSPPPSAVSDVNPDGQPSEPRFGGRCLGISISPTDTDNAFVASELGGIWRTTNGGDTWSHRDDIPLTVSRDVMYDPQDANILIATGRYDGTVANNGGIWRSTDGGNTWSKPATSNPACSNEASAWGISIPNDPVEHVNIFVGTDCGVAISDDSGATWTHVDPCTAADAGFCGTGGTIFDVEARVVGGDIQVDVCGAEGYFRSSDGGNTWSAPDPNSPSLVGLNPCHIATAPQDPDTVYLANWSGTTPSGFCQAQLLESTTGGTAGSWVDMGIGAQNCRDAWVVTHPALSGDADEFEVYVGDSQRMRRQTCDSTSTPRCQTGAGNWPTADSGAHADPSDIAFDTSSPNGCPLLASNDGGMASSSDCGATWDDANRSLHALDIVDMAGTVNPGATDLYLGTQDNGMYFTNDNASTWTRPRGADVYNVEADHNPPARVFFRQCFGCSNRIADPNFASLSGAGAFTDPPGNVGTFARVTQFGPLSYAMLTNDGATPATWSVYVTTDEGATWNQMGPALPGSPGEIRSSGPAAAPTFWIRLSVGGARRMYRLTGAFDNTATLALRNTGLSVPTAAWAVDPNNPNLLYVADIGTDQMMFTTDGGQIWDSDPALTDIVTQNGDYRFDSNTWRNQVWSIGIDSNSNTILVGTRNAGLYVSVNGGVSWVIVPGSELLPRFRDYFFDESDGSIYAATSGRGVWRIQLASADLSVDKTDSPDPVAGGAANGTLTYTVTVSNDGPDIAHEVVVTDTFPDGTIHTGDTGGCVVGPGRLLTCNLGDLDPESETSFEFTVEVSSCEPVITNEVAVESLDPDPDPTNNMATEDTAVIDVTPPIIIDCNAVGGFVDENCEFTVTFDTVVTDDCCVNADDVTVDVTLPTGNATLGTPVINKQQTAVDRVDVTGSVVVSALTSCPATVRVEIDAVDCSGNLAESSCVATADVNDNIPPEIVCPDPLFLGRGPDAVCPMTPQEWLDSVVVSDNCDPDPEVVNDSDAQSAECCIFPCDGTTIVTFDVTDDCMNTNSCQGEITSDPNHPGWNNLDVAINLTGNQPTYWSGETGQPAGVSAFDVLDPGCLKGRVDPECGGFRTMRGYIVAWAVDNLGREIQWNHLAGDATVVNYADGSAWEYNAYAFQAESPNQVHGAVTGTPGTLMLDGTEYANGPDMLLLDFFAVDATSFGAGGIDTDLTLLPISVDLKQETAGPVTTKASFTVWNMNEVKFTGLDRCVSCWDQLLLRNYGPPNHFLLSNLHTDRGKARIDGLASQLCNVDYDPADGQLGSDPRDVVSQAASMLGVAVKRIDFSVANEVPDRGGAPGRSDTAGMNLTVMGTQPATIEADYLGDPPPSRPTTGGGDDALDRVDGPRARPASARTELSPVAEGSGAIPIQTAIEPDDRVSGSEKGSLLIFPMVELRWDAEGNLLQDTFLNVINDYPGGVQVQMYFINGDPPLTGEVDGDDGGEDEEVDIT